MKVITDLSLVLLHFVAAYCVFDAMNMVFSSAVKGAGDTRFVMVTMILASAFVLIGPTYAAIFIFKKGLIFSWVILTIPRGDIGPESFFFDSSADGGKQCGSSRKTRKS